VQQDIANLNAALSEAHPEEGLHDRRVSGRHAPISYETSMYHPAATLYLAHLTDIMKEE